MSRVEELRQQGLAKLRVNAIEEALSLFDQALANAADDESRELLTIDKAGALLTMERTGPEVQKLPQILMRRRNVRHVYLAAYHLETKFRNEHDFSKAGFYARIALEAAEEAGNQEWIASALIALGMDCGFDSRDDEAAQYFQRALAVLPEKSDGLARAFAVHNLGYSKIMTASPAEGVELIHKSIELFFGEGSEAFCAESYLDLCLGYLDLGDFEQARTFGELGLEKATEVRQTRNAHYLLGEISYKLGDVELAEFHFDHLATHYPDFPQLKNLLFAIDLRKMVNFKL
ncbi:MAG: hypothetical protein ABI718_12625 [Acidobacteriota bacterium]